MAKLPKIYRSSIPNVSIIGAGIIGMSCALELTRRGASVTLHDKRVRGRGASVAAAGMLSPAFEAASEEGAHPKLFDLCMESGRIWPEYASDLEARTKSDLSYCRGNTLAVSMDSKDEEHICKLRSSLDVRGVSYEALSPEEACEREPCLSSSNRGGLHLPTDGRVDNRAVFRELSRLADYENRLTYRDNEPHLAQTSEGLRVEGADCVVLAAGYETPRIAVRQSSDKDISAFEPALTNILPVSGQMLAVKLEAPLTTTIRAGSLYVTPRDGATVIGASVEPGVLTAPTLNVIAQLKARAGQLIPSLAGAETQAVWTGTRPGTPDHAPLIGETRCSRVYVAAGHYRNGILLAPITAKFIADMILDDNVSDLAAAFSPRRFEGAVH